MQYKIATSEVCYMKSVTYRICGLLVVFLMCGCSPVPIPYLRGVPEGLKRVVVQDVDTNEKIEDACVEIHYDKAKQACMPFEPKVFADVSELQEYELPEGLRYQRAIKVKKNKRNDFVVKGKLKVASVQPIWLPALPHTIFNDYAIWVKVQADGYSPLNLWYYSVNLPKGEFRTKEGGIAELKKSGALKVRLKRL